jgi:hypothetical protein
MNRRHETEDSDESVPSSAPYPPSIHISSLSCAPASSRAAVSVSTAFLSPLTY